MSTSDSNPDAPLDDQLRSVPLPEGLLVRLRQIALADDDGLDAALREVATPAGLLQRLRLVAVADDADLDAALREVPVPAGLTARVQESVETYDEELMAAIRGRPSPARPPARAGRGARGRRLRGMRWVTAVSLWVAVALAGFAGLLALLVAVWPAAGPAPPALPSVGSFARHEHAEPEFSPLGEPLRGGEQPGGAADRLPMPLLRPDVAQRLERPPAPATDPLHPFGRPHAGRGVDPLLDATPYTWPNDTILRGFGASQSEIDRLPELKKVAGPTPQGIKPPLVPGFPLDYYNRYGFHPFVSPAAHPKLQKCVVPLGLSAASYELTRRYLEDGELPPPEKVRTEEFLAAIDYEYPDPKRGPLGLTLVAGPSPFGGEGLTLLQVGVQGRRFRDEKHAPVHLVFAVDVSGSMEWGGRLDMIKRSLARLIEQLGPDDRVSLVTFDEEARTLLEDAGPDDIYSLRTAVASLAARGSTNIGVGLRHAYTVAQNVATTARGGVRVVLCTDGTAVPDHGTAGAIGERLADAAAHGIRLEVIDLGQSADPDPELLDFARSGRGQVRRAASANEMYWTLLEIITGKPQLIAGAVRLEVGFNPKSVLEYRLLGHEASGIVGLMPDHPETDFHSGQSATALYEVRLKPGVMTEVATAELTWQGPGRGPAQRLSRKIHLKEFAYTFAQAAPSLQAAALAAQTAEVLRRHPHTLRAGQSFGRILETAVQADPRLSQHPSFAEFLALVQQADKVKPSRNGTKRQ